jgi:hypothetical protein
MKILWALIILQIIFSLYLTGKQVIFNSNLRLWLSSDYFWHEKLQMMLGGDYHIAQQLKMLPKDTGILLVRQGDPWFINYYMMPRRMYSYREATNKELTNMTRLQKVPAKWLKEREIEYVLLYGAREVRILKVGKDIKFK